MAGRGAIDMHTIKVTTTDSSLWRSIVGRMWPFFSDHEFWVVGRGDSIPANWTSKWWDQKSTIYSARSQGINACSPRLSRLESCWPSGWYIMVVGRLTLFCNSFFLWTSYIRFWLYLLLLLDPLDGEDQCAWPGDS